MRSNVCTSFMLLIDEIYNEIKVFYFWAFLVIFTMFLLVLVECWMEAHGKSPS